ncbi:MAG: ABC transporter permease [Gammaproteobacteria bacterium]|nr:ABC transporter permease [Gammaproteobacteria bacterium]
MLDLDKWEEIWLTMMNHKLRTALTSFGVFWGIFMLVILLGAGNGLQNGAMQNFDIAKNAVFVWTMPTAVPFAGFDAGRQIELSNEDSEALSQLLEVKTISPRLRIANRFGDRALNIVRGNKSVAFNIMGDYPEFLEIKPYILEEGRFLNELDMIGNRKVAVIGLRVRDELFETDEQVIGKYIRIGGIPFKVVGVFNTRVMGEQAIQEQQTLHVPLTTAQHMYNLGSRVDWFGFIPADGITALDTENAVKDILRARHKISPDDRAALGTFNVEQEFREMQGVFSGINGFSWFVAIGTIVAGMVGVGNIMLIIVKERTKEIGIRKSVGAKPISIITMIVLEALAISSFAGYLGLVSGVALIEGIALMMERFEMQNEFFANPEIDFGVAMSAIGVLMVSGSLAGLFPGIMAARVNPVVALRDE